MGERTCSGGEWGSCEGDRLARVATGDSGQRAQGLGSSAACIDNPCDPYCQVVVDDGDGLDVSDDLTATGDGLSLTGVPPKPEDVITCTDIELDPPVQTLTITQINATQGLLGEYYNQRNSSVSSIPAAWTVTAQRVDARVNFDWGGSAPGVAGVGADNFSVRWSGFVNPPATGDYTFYTRTDDGVRLWVNDVLVIDKWIDQGPTQYATTAIALTKGTLAKIRMEYFENGGGAVAQLKWSSSAIAEQIIPEQYLVPPTGNGDPFVISPETADFTVSVVPPDCYDGVFDAVWSLDKLDRATIESGSLSVVSPVAGPIEVSAYVQEFSDTAQVNVVVDAVDTTEAPAGSAATFGGNMSSGPDTVTILYPYDGTVLPLALNPPLLQWDNAGVAASAVKVSLTYPDAGTPTFSWSKIIAPPSDGRFTFPRDVWGYFERTAKGDTGRISVQRIVGGQLKDAVSKTVRFAEAPLRGNIYYTQYGGGSKIMRLDPSQDSPAVNAFSTDNGCPVCHSMSANGSMFATADRGWSANGGIAKVETSGALTPLSDFVSPTSPYSDGRDDWRGFAWAPLTPDGKYIFAANNIWGNSRQAVVGINSSTRVVELPSTFVSGGRGTGLLARYYSTNNFSGWAWKRIDARIDFDWAGSPGGPIPADAFSVVWEGEIEGYFTETHTFSLETTAGVRLTVGGNVIIDQLAYSGAATTFTGQAALTRGARTPLLLEAVDMNATTMVKLRWSSAQVPYALVPQHMLYPAGGLRGAVVALQDSAGNSLTRHESDLSSDWGSRAPGKGINADNFTSTWDALVEAPATGNLEWCIQSDDGVVVKVDGVTVISGAGVTNSCATAMAVVEGQKYAINIAHTELSGDARAKLRWKMAGFIPSEEDIASAYVFPPATYTPPSTGLSAVFYDTIDFGASVPTNATTPQGYQTYVPNLDYDWGDGRYSRGRALTSSDTWSGRFTGQIQPACTGVHELEVFADDYAALWIGAERVVHVPSYGTKTGAIWLDANLMYDFKLDWAENTGGAAVRLRWKPACSGALSFSVVPEANFRPSGDTTLNGYLRSGGDNGNGYQYYAWETPSSAGAAPVDVTSQSAGNWGLGASVMMVPTFAPDGSKLVFVDGDSATGAGWRKGLSTFDFSQTDKLFKNRRQIVNTFPYGDVIKWPTFESDSRSVIYQTTTPGDVCCRNNWTKYGYMGPSNYFEDPGRQWSVDTQSASPTPVLLSRLNDGERAVDRNKAYQATMLPTPAGGYRWVVFTSTRPYGNVLNLPAVQQDYSDVNAYTAMLNTSQLQSMLWVSAIDDQVSGNTDRSHPSFFLPNQNYSSSGGGYLNERAYWVTEACRPVGTGDTSLCDVDEDCCGGSGASKTAVCRIDTPVSQPPTRHCSAVPGPNTCVPESGACSTNTDCCFGLVCAGNVCTEPPPLPHYYPANFERVYTAECGDGTLPVWRFFDWQAETPPTGSAIEIYAESAADPMDFHDLPVAPAPVNIPSVVHVATVTGPTVPGWVGEDVGALLEDAELVQHHYLKITIRFIASQRKTATPILHEWRQSYSCPPAE
jgi:hypothetical protein